MADDKPKHRCRGFRFFVRHGVHGHVCSRCGGKFPDPDGCNRCLQDWAYERSEADNRVLRAKVQALTAAGNNMAADLISHIRAAKRPGTLEAKYESFMAWRSALGAGLEKYGQGVPAAAGGAAAGAAAPDATGTG